MVDDTKSCRFPSVRCTEKELNQIKEKASNAHLTPSEFIRRCVFGRVIKPAFDNKTIIELSQLGQQLKQITDDENQQDINDVLTEIKRAIVRIGYTQ